MTTDALLNPAAWSSRRAYAAWEAEATAEAELLLASGWRPAARDWRKRLPTVYTPYLWHPFSRPHEELWSWVAAIEPDDSPAPFIAIWPRGRGKSTNAELAVADLGGRGARRYALVVSETQDQADKHVSTVQNMLEREEANSYLYEVSRPRIGKHGSRQWRRSIMTTASGYTVEAVGLDKAVRGQKIDWARPDLIVLDDIDAKHDGPRATQRKIETLTMSILPAGAPNCAVLFVQNLIFRGSIAHALSLAPGQPGAADFLADRTISGPYKAVEDLVYAYEEQSDGSYRWRITGGRSIWHGYTLAVCEDELNRSGPTAFDLESQHEIDTDSPQALLSTAVLDRTRVSSYPNLIKVVVAVDPQGGAGETGIIAAGVGKINDVLHSYTLADTSTPQGTSTNEWGTAVLQLYYTMAADEIVVESNFGGDMVKATIQAIRLTDAEGNVLVDGARVPIVEVYASRGKELRAQPVAALFEQGLAHHAGHFPLLQRQWTTWEPGTKPSPDRMDADVWAHTRLMLAGSSNKPVTPKALRPRVVRAEDVFR